MSLKSEFLAMRRSVAVNLANGFRLVALRSAAFDASVGQLLLLIALGWGAAIAADWRMTEGPRQLSLWGFTAEAARSYVWLATLACLVSVNTLGGRTGRFLQLAVALAAADVVVWLIWLGLVWLGPWFVGDFYQRHGLHAWWVFFVWQVAIFTALWMRRGDGRMIDTVATVFYAGMLYLNLHVLPDYPLVEAREVDSDGPALSVEDAYYGQAALLENATRGLRAGAPGVIDLNVVTFGGYGAEDVFKREALQVSRILAARFATGDRSVQLINNPRTVTRYPLANRPNLAYVLGHLATRMQRDEDILFLFLTSHGYEDGTFAIELESMGLNDLQPRTLREVLDQAGIHWRVIVVSACYSGQFIDALKSPNTLVVTAAAGDKSSFGCAHENDWTYFGEAFFKQAVVTTRSFSTAFELAKIAIAKREKREGKEPSNPQISAGTAITAHLERFEAQFDH